MKRWSELLWPVLVGALSLGVTAWLWSHERQTQDRHLKDNFDAGLRQTATHIEERMTSYEQALRGVRGLFDASEHVTRDDFATYVDAQLVGPDAAGLRTIAFVPLVEARDRDAHVAAQRAGGVPGYDITPPGPRDRLAPVTYAAPVTDTSDAALGVDLLTDPVRRAAMLRAGDSGSAAISDKVRFIAMPDQAPDSGFLMLMPLYHKEKGQTADTAASRRAHLRGWVLATFRVTDLMSSVYGEETPGLDVRIYDSAQASPATLMYPVHEPPPPSEPARFDTQEFISFAGHSWTLAARSTSEFERRYSNDATRIIAIAGGGLSLLLSLLTWQLATARGRANDAARQMTRQLREGAEQYRRIVDTASEGIWSTDVDGRTTFVNPKMEQLLGYSAGDILGRRWIEFMDRGEGLALMRDIEARLRPGGSAELRDVRLRRRDGSDLWATLSSSPIVDASGARTGVLSMVTDATDRKVFEANRATLEAQLRQSQKMEAIGTLAGGIAHDFNNILAAILGNVSMVEQDLGVAHPSRGRLEQIGKAGVRARNLVQQIVAFSRQQPQVLVVQPLRPLLEESVELLRSTLPALVQFEVQLSAAPLLIGGDATQLQQVLMNLCTNAWHALYGSTGRIVVGLEPVELDAGAADRLGGLFAGPHAHVWVSDDGCGMDEATRLRVFEPFFTTKVVGLGTGLGLSVVHGIVTGHRGAITVRSSPGHGSTFDMYFPLAAPVAAEPSLPVDAGVVVRGDGEHVLYVDDDPVMLLMVESLLQRAGYRVSALADPREALQRVRDEPDAFDIVVTDFNMPAMSGLELARELIRLRPALPVVISSGYVSDSLRNDVLQAGVRHVLQKEYTREQLADVVRRALAGAAG
ncbi:MAG: CHASE domain-containing protein [Burkholderiales bacterium]